MVATTGGPSSDYRRIMSDRYYPYILNYVNAARCHPNGSSTSTTFSDAFSSQGHRLPDSLPTTFGKLLSVFFKGIAQERMHLLADSLPLMITLILNPRFARMIVNLAGKALKLGYVGEVQLLSMLKAVRRFCCRYQCSGIQISSILLLIRAFGVRQLSSAQSLMAAAVIFVVKSFSEAASQRIQPPKITPTKTIPKEKGAIATVETTPEVKTTPKVETAPEVETIPEVGTVPEAFTRPKAPTRPSSRSPTTPLSKASTSPSSKCSAPPVKVRLNGDKASTQSFVLCSLSSVLVQNDDDESSNGDKDSYMLCPISGVLVSNDDKESSNADEKSLDGDEESSSVDKESPNADKESSNVDKESSNGDKESPNADKESSNGDKESPNGDNEGPDDGKPSLGEADKH